MPQLTRYPQRTGVVLFLSSQTVPNLVARSKPLSEQVKGSVAVSKRVLKFSFKYFSVFLIICNTVFSNCKFLLVVSDLVSSRQILVCYKVTNSLHLINPSTLKS